MFQEERPPLPAYFILYAVWLAAVFLLTGGFESLPNWLDSWVKWDAHWYERIWSEGYPKEDPRSLVFPPGYPLVVGSISSLTSLNFHTSALILNIASYFALCLISAECLGKIFSLPRLPLFVLPLTSPAAYFVFTAYSDALFSAMLWIAIHCTLAHPKSVRAQLAEFCLLLAMPWVRLTGFAMAAWILTKRWTSAAVAISLFGWLALNFEISGKFTYFLEAQALFEMPQGHFLNGAVYTFQGLLSFSDFVSRNDLTGYFQFHFLPATYLLILCGTAFWLCRKKQWLLGVTVLSVLLMSHNQSFWRSAVRYDLPILPCFYAALMATMKSENEKLPPIAISILIALGLLQMSMMISFARLFQVGEWAF